MNFDQFVKKYSSFFFVVTQKTAINPVALMQISFLLTGSKTNLLKFNNFFAVARNNVFNKYSTPFAGIEAGVNLIVNNPKFAVLKAGTLKANPEKQVEKIKQILDIV